MDSLRNDRLTVLYGERRLVAWNVLKDKLPDIFGVGKDNSIKSMLEDADIRPSLHCQDNDILFLEIREIPTGHIFKSGKLRLCKGLASNWKLDLTLSKEQFCDSGNTMYLGLSWQGNDGEYSQAVSGSFLSRLGSEFEVSGSEVKYHRIGIGKYKYQTSFDDGGQIIVDQPTETLKMVKKESENQILMRFSSVINIHDLHLPLKIGHNENLEKPPSH